MTEMNIYDDKPGGPRIPHVIVFCVCVDQQAEIALSKIDASAPGRRLDALETLRIGLVPRRGCVFIETNATFSFFRFFISAFFPAWLTSGGLPAQRGTIPCERQWSYFLSLFSPKQRMLGQPVFHLLSNLAFLRHIRARYNRNIVRTWARRDHVLA